MPKVLIEPAKQRGKKDSPIKIEKKTMEKKLSKTGSFFKAIQRQGSQIFDKIEDATGRISIGALISPRKPSFKFPNTKTIDVKENQYNGIRLLNTSGKYFNNNNNVNNNNNTVKSNTSSANLMKKLSSLAKKPSVPKLDLHQLPSKYKLAEGGIVTEVQSDRRPPTIIDSDVVTEIDEVDIKEVDSPNKHHEQQQGSSSSGINNTRVDGGITLDEYGMEILNDGYRSSSIASLSTGSESRAIQASAEKKKKGLLSLFQKDKKNDPPEVAKTPPQKMLDRVENEFDGSLTNAILAKYDLLEKEKTE